MFALRTHSRTRNANDDPASGQAGFRVASVSAALILQLTHSNDAGDAAGVKGRHWCTYCDRSVRRLGAVLKAAINTRAAPMSDLNSSGDPLQPDSYG
jgi:hypothetical protein